MSKTCNPDSCSTIGVLQLQIDGLVDKLGQQAEQIKSMRNCDNCKNLGTCADDDGDIFNNCHKNNLNLWEWDGGSGE